MHATMTAPIRVQLTRKVLYEVHSLAEASDACRDFINGHNLGASECCAGFGTVYDAAQRKVAKISYNGRIWDLQGKEIACAS